MLRYLDQLIPVLEIWKIPMPDMIAALTNQVALMNKNAPIICETLGVECQRFDSMKELLHAICNEDFFYRK